MPGYSFLISFWGLSWLVFRRQGRRPELCLFTTLAGLIVALYLCALSSLLRPGALALFWLGIAGAAWGLFDGLARPGGWFKIYFSPGVSLVLASGFAFHLAFGQASLQWWDEFSHWGVAARNLLLTHSLPSPQGAIMYQEYPPGAALLEYFAAVNTGGDESIFYLAHFLLSVVPLATILYGVPWRRVWWIVILVPALASLAATLNFYICSLMVDTVLSTNVAAALLWAARLKLTPRALMPLVPPLLVLPLIKGSGLMFALCVTAVLATCWLLEKTWVKQSDRGPASTAFTRRLLPLAGVLLILSAPLWAHYSWALRGQALGITPTFDTNDASVPGAIMACTSYGNPHYSKVVAQFGPALVSEPLSYRQQERNLVTSWQQRLDLPDWLAPAPLALPGWLGLTAVLALAGFLRRPSRRKRRRMIVIWTWLAVFGVIYALGLLVLYLFCFPLHEAEELASFARYMNTYLLAMLLVGLGLAACEVQAQGSAHRSRWQRGASAACLSLFLLGALSQTTSWNYLPTWAPFPRAVTPDRERLRPAVEQAWQLIPADKKVYLVHQGSDGFQFHLLRYELVPRSTNHGGWSLGRPFFPGDVWSQDLSPKQWASILAQGYEYVLLAKTDQTFWDRYGPLFEPPPPMGALVFKVVKKASGAIRLVSAQTMEARRR
jgi:hypothetical protein